MLADDLLTPGMKKKYIYLGWRSMRILVSEGYKAELRGVADQ